MTAPEYHTHTLRETEKDKKKEKKILDAVAAHFRAEAQQVMTFGKYKIDGILHQGSKVVAFVECKWLSKPGFYGINLPKHIEGCNLASYAQVPFIYAVRVPNRVGFAVVHNGTWMQNEPTLRWTGGVLTPPNWDDIEPMMMIEPDKIQWLDYLTSTKKPTLGGQSCQRQGEPLMGLAGGELTS